ncbi:GNAT family N-acetyltransferase [Nonomuraea guangzhouensis]|uniref:GNAT family N-acetyltransferase n=1 Tax=Nonomuraea guangzhouensis TaxID=1291555 RepID=A0ABW4G8Q9_9ACTN|nr:GNAT family protein [Nonomuraea guangzhouensis]
MTIRLRSAAEDDLPFLNRLINDPESTGLHQWYGWQDPHRIRRRWEENGMLHDDGGLLLIADGDDRVGFMSWSKQVTSRVAYCWEMGIIVAPEFRGKGHGTRAQRLLVRYLFDHSPVNRVQATTEVSNMGEQRALEKAGFTREGVLRGVGFRAGEWHDGVMYAVIRADLDTRI